MPSSYLENLLTTARLREPALKAAVQALNLPKGSAGLDAGCGSGLLSLLLAEELGTEGHVTGIDISREFLTYGERIVQDAGLVEQISFKEGSLKAIPFADSSFDWVWSSDCVGYGPWEPMPLLEELKRVTKPGGTLAISAWSSERLLPGYPLLEAKLSTTVSGLAPFTTEMAPSRHFPRALGWLRKLNLLDPMAETFSGGVHAPLSEDAFNALEALFGMRWVGVEDELSQSDRATYRRLCKPESPDFILTHPDYYAFFTYSLFYGTVK